MTSIAIFLFTPVYPKHVVRLSEIIGKILGAAFVMSARTFFRHFLVPTNLPALLLNPRYISQLLEVEDDRGYVGRSTSAKFHL